MTRLQLTSAAQLRVLPDGAILTGSAGQRLFWLSVWAHPHPDPDSGLWTLPRNLFAEWDLEEIDVELPERTPTPRPVSVGDEPWLSTLDDPHDTTQH